MIGLSEGYLRASVPSEVHIHSDIHLSVRQMNTPRAKDVDTHPSTKKIRGTDAAPTVPSMPYHAKQVAVAGTKSLAYHHVGGTTFDFFSFLYGPKIAKVTSRLPKFFD